MRVTQDVQRRLLSSLADLGLGQAESEDDALIAKRFLSVRNHSTTNRHLISRIGRQS